MNLGDILVAKGLVSPEQIATALEHQKQHGGRLGESLAALGIATVEQIEQVINEAPRAPLTLDDAGIDPMFMLQLLLKGMYTENLELPSRMAEAMRIPGGMVNRLLQDAKDRKLVEATGSDSGSAGGIAEMRHALTRQGREWAAEAMEQSSYFGPAPVSLAAWTQRIEQQRITNEWVSRPMLDEAMAHIVVPDKFVRRLGPAVNSGSAILIYGPAGNGKTTIAEIVGKIFENVIYVPYCVDLGGDVMQVYDPTIHRAVAGSAGTTESGMGARRQRIDQRWVACYRPLVITGGELNLEMLDLKFNPLAKFYEAPLHIKALNGTFLIDDFGRQRAKPEDILNRWIVPLNSKVDYLILHSGKTVQVPFDEIVIFSTNLHPNDLMDPAFQRRIAYKLETLEPPEDLFRTVFDNMAKGKGLELTDDVYNQVIAGVRANEAPLAYFQPKFIIEQVLASCKFEGAKPQFTYEYVEDALTNLFVQQAQSQMFGVKR
jgi:predicted ATPase with chaperone activity